MFPLGFLPPPKTCVSGGLRWTGVFFLSAQGSRLLRMNNNKKKNSSGTDCFKIEQRRNRCCTFEIYYTIIIRSNFVWQIFIHIYFESSSHLCIILSIPSIFVNMFSRRHKFLWHNPDLTINLSFLDNYSFGATFTSESPCKLVHRVDMMHMWHCVKIVQMNVTPLWMGQILRRGPQRRWFVKSSGHLDSRLCL